jgi:hypothetical protein
MNKVELPNDVELLKQIILRQQSRLDYLEEQFRLAQQKLHINIQPDHLITLMPIT